MSGRFVIRPASLSMTPVLAGLHAESFGEERWSAGQIEGSLALPTTKAWVAYDEDMPLGFILCQIVPGEAEILTLCVSPARRRQRIGEALLRCMIDAVRAEGSAKIFLEVAADNSAARKLYEQQGFTITGTRAGYYKRNGEAVDGVMYGYEFIENQG